MMRVIALVSWAMIVAGATAAFVEEQHLLLLPEKQVKSDASKYACSSREEELMAFCCRGLSVEERVKDLVSRLSVEEKISQLVNSASNISRLGIPSYQWWSEALHGLAPNGPGVHFGPAVPAVTTFPQVILSAASFNRSLWNLIAQAVSTEARAMYNVGLAGLTYWSPNLNIFRDPRWGRGQETPGEDPLLSSEYGVAYVKGLQGQPYHEDFYMGMSGTRRRNVNSVSAGSLKVSACCKHFTAYDLEAWGGYSRYTFDALVSHQDLIDTYQPPFKTCIQDGQATCVMCSYNRVNGVPACANENLLTHIARQEWGFNGYITSDCDAVAVVYEYIGYASSPEDAVADCLNAGLDLNCGTYISGHALTAIREGMINMSRVDQALSNLFTVQMQLGLFDGDPKTQRYGSIGPDVVCSESHCLLALEAARQGLVLLKNEEATLPLSKEHLVKLAVIGPNANASGDALLGNYAGVPCFSVTPLQGLQNYTEVIYEPGCIDVWCKSDLLKQAAVDISLTADAVIIIAGLDQSQEQEDHDRVELVLPGYQQQLVSEVANAAKGPVVLVILSGGPVDIMFARDNQNIQSIVWAGYPGQSGGQAIAELIFGDFNPGGRLPITWYPASFADVPMTDMNMRPNLSRNYPGRTYRFYEGDAIFKFGHGLSFTNFTYTFVSTPSEILLMSCTNELHEEIIHAQENLIMCYGSISQPVWLNVTVRVSNMGNRSGSHSLLLFSKHLSRQAGSPQKQLVGFKKVHLDAQASDDVVFTLDIFEHLSVVDKEGKKMLILGSYALVVNDSIEHTWVVKILEQSAK